MQFAQAIVRQGMTGTTKKVSVASKTGYFLGMYFYLLNISPKSPISKQIRFKIFRNSEALIVKCNFRGENYITLKMLVKT